MSTPRIVGTIEDSHQHYTWRIVQMANGNFIAEKQDGCDALGVPVWRRAEPTTDLLGALLGAYGGLCAAHLDEEAQP